MIFTNSATDRCLQNDGYGNLSTQPCTDAPDQAWREYVTLSGDMF
jgi:hypothetical protein